jgi:hypothetical protein
MNQEPYPGYGALAPKNPTVQSYENSYNSAQGAVQTLLAPMGPEMQTNAATMAGYQSELGPNGTIAQGVNNANNYATAMAGIQGQQAGINNKQIGLQQLGNTQSQANSVYQQGLEKGEYANAAATAVAGQNAEVNQYQLAYGNQPGSTFNLQNTNAQTQQGIETQQYNLAMGQYPEQLQQAATANQQAVMGLQGQVAASGVQGAAGANLAQAAQAQNYGFQQADINRAQQTAILGQQGEVANYTTNQAVAQNQLASAQQGQLAEQQSYNANYDPNNPNSTMALQQQGEIGNYNLSQEQYANQAQNLSYMAQSNGLSEEQVIDQLNYGISQNDQSGMQSAQQVLANMGNLQSGEVTQEQTALAPLAYAGGINPYAG